MVVAAANFAAQKHVNQRRKGAKAEPYINHLAEVAHLIASTVEEPDAYLVAVAWLHDTLEDTQTMPDEIRRLFGDHVLSLVWELTDDKTLPKAERKELQVSGTPAKSIEARLVKLADLTSNLRSLRSDPPVNWSDTRIAAYVDWARAVGASCRGLNEALEAEFDQAVAACVDAPPTLGAA